MVLRQATRAGWLLLLVAASTSWDAMAQTAGQLTTPGAPRASELRSAAERFDEGRTAYKAGAFVEAAEHFEAADRHAPSVSALGLAMRSREGAGQLLRAANLAELVLRRYPEDVELSEKAKAIIESAAMGSARVTIECEPACEMVVDRRLSHGRSQQQWIFYLEPGQHALVANWTGERVAAKQISVGVGESSMHAFKLVETEPAVSRTKDSTHLERGAFFGPSAAAQEGKRKAFPPTWFWVGVGATAVVGGTAIWSGIDTLYHPGRDAVRQGCVNQYEECSLYQQGQRNELRTHILLATASVLAVATVVTGVFFTDFSPTTSSSQASIVRLRPWVDARVVAESSSPTGPIGQVTLVGAEGRF